MTAGPIVNLTVIPTGGAVLLSMPEYFQPPSGVVSMTVSRSVSGSGSWTQLWTGALLPQFFDVGDMLPAPLSATTAYAWQVADSRGVTQTDYVFPASTMIPVPDQLTQLFIKLLQGALNSSTLPPGVQPVQVTTRMPQNGWQALPFIVVNLDLVQQSEVGIGEDVVRPALDNEWSLWANAKRVWRVTILSVDSEERDYYRDFLMSAFRVLKATAFAPIGLDVRHSFQAASYTDAQEWEGKTPGFYGADIMLELDGTFPVAVVTSYGTIAKIDATPNIVANTEVIEVPSQPK